MWLALNYFFKTDWINSIEISWSWPTNQNTIGQQIDQNCFRNWFKIIWSIIPKDEILKHFTFDLMYVVIIFINWHSLKHNFDQPLSFKKDFDQLQKQFWSIVILWKWFSSTAFQSVVFWSVDFTSEVFDGDNWF